MNCSCCPPKNINDLDNTFNEKHAGRDAEDYLKHGLNKRGQRLVAALSGRITSPLSVLDIGCGAGGLHHDLLRRGIAGRVTGVDASSAYLRFAAQNAAKLNLSQQVRYVQRDFAQTAGEFAPAGLVTLDRVICCYPYLEQLLSAAAVRAEQYLALTFPIEGWWLKAPYWLIDSLFTLFRSQYHFFLHPRSQVIAIAGAAGLQPIHHERVGFWQLLLLAR